MPVLTSRAKEYQFLIQPCRRGRDRRAGAKIGEKWRRLNFAMIGVENNFSDRFGFLLCFLRCHFDMFGHDGSFQVTNGCH